jgi:hypothetical protein
MANKADNAMDRIADKIPDRVKIVASEEAKQIRTLATQAAKSGAYLYPLRVRNHHAKVILLDLY